MSLLAAVSKQHPDRLFICLAILKIPISRSLMHSHLFFQCKLFLGTDSMFRCLLSTSLSKYGKALHARKRKFASENQRLVSFGHFYDEYSRIWYNINNNLPLDLAAIVESLVITCNILCEILQCALFVNFASQSGVKVLTFDLPFSFFQPAEVKK